MSIRPATAADHDAIRAVLDAAFGNDHASLIVDGVRAEGAVLAELVAEQNGEIVGQVLFSRMTVTPAGLFGGLGPVGVRPDLQNGGFGDALCRAGIDAVRALGAEAVVVLGHPPYYPRFGFSHAAASKIASPFSDRPAFMAMALVPGALDAPLKVDYPAAFG